VGPVAGVSNRTVTVSLPAPLSTRVPTTRTSAPPGSLLRCERGEEPLEEFGQVTLFPCLLYGNRNETIRFCHLPCRASAYSLGGVVAAPGIRQSAPEDRDTRSLPGKDAVSVPSS